MKRFLKYLFLACLFLGIQMPSWGQKVALTTNMGDVLLLGTMNLEVDYAFAQGLSCEAGVRYNPWTFGSGDCDVQSQLRQRAVYAGMRFWPWYVYSGFFAGVKGQYQEYSYGGFSQRLPSEEGDAYGLVVEAGYALLIHHNWDISFGVSGWGGMKDYVRYECPFCGRKLEQGRKGFLLPDALIVSLSYIF